MKLNEKPQGLGWGTGTNNNITDCIDYIIVFVRSMIKYRGPMFVNLYPLTCARRFDGRWFSGDGGDLVNALRCDPCRRPMTIVPTITRRRYSFNTQEVLVQHRRYWNNERRVGSTLATAKRSRWRHVPILAVGTSAKKKYRVFTAAGKKMWRGRPPLPFRTFARTRPVRSP